MKLKLLLALLVFQINFAQERTCGTQDYMQKMLSNPVALKNYKNFQEKFEKELAKLDNSVNKNSAAPNVTIYIPVAVHFPDEPTTSDNKICLRNLAQSQINVLNADYNGTNSDISLWTPSVNAFYPGVNTGSLDVQFVLATQNHPAGIGLVNGDLAVTFGTSYLGGADNDPDWSGYINLVCRDAGNGILGYSPLGGIPNNGETVVISFEAFGEGSGCTGYVPSAPYNLGRTLTHELGHFFNLDHTFDGCTTSSNCSTSGDKVCDTPASNAPVFGCPVAGGITKCGVKTLTMNYMDYVDDACMYMFTAGQATRMQAYYNVIASQLKTDVLSNNVFLTSNFSIVPNPSNGTFNIQLKEVLENYSVEIFDMTGRIIFENNYFKDQSLQQTILLDNSTSGVYFVSIKSGSSILTNKIIIK